MPIHYFEWDIFFAVYSKSALKPRFGGRFLKFNGIPKQ